MDNLTDNNVTEIKKNNNEIFSCSDSEKKFKEKTGEEFIVFYQKYKPKLEWTLFKMCNDKDDASDIATDAFLKALHKIEQYNPDFKFSTWLFTIAKRIMFDRIEEKKSMVSIDESIDEEFTLMDVLADHPTGENSEKDVEKAQYLSQKIMNLKEKYKRVMIMREIEGRSYLDISKDLKTNLSTIKSRIRNARLILRREVENEFEKIDGNYLY